MEVCVWVVVFGWNDCLIVLEICVVGLWVGLWFFGVWGSWLCEKRCVGFDLVFGYCGGLCLLVNLV